MLNKFIFSIIMFLSVISVTYTKDYIKDVVLDERDADTILEELNSMPGHPALTARLGSIGADISRYVASLDPNNKHLQNLNLAFIIPAIVWEETILGTKEENAKGKGFGLFNIKYNLILNVLASATNSSKEEVSKTYTYDNYVKDITANIQDEILMYTVLFQRVADRCYYLLERGEIESVDFNKCFITLVKNNTLKDINLKTDVDKYVVNIKIKAHALKRYYKLIESTTEENKIFFDKILTKIEKKCDFKCLEELISNNYNKPIKWE